MELGLFFWVFYVVAILFGFWSNYEANTPWFKRAGAYAILWLLVGVIGWQVFGPVLHR